jgi:hypothetical protein
VALNERNESIPKYCLFSDASGGIYYFVVPVCSGAVTAGSLDSLLPAGRVGRQSSHSYVSMHPQTTSGGFSMKSCRAPGHDMKSSRWNFAMKSCRSETLVCTLAVILDQFQSCIKFTLSMAGKLKCQVTYLKAYLAKDGKLKLSGSVLCW